MKDREGKIEWGKKESIFIIGQHSSFFAQSRILLRFISDPLIWLVASTFDLSRCLFLFLFQWQWLCLCACYWFLFDFVTQRCIYYPIIFASNQPTLWHHKYNATHQVRVQALSICQALNSHTNELAIQRVWIKAEVCRWHRELTKASINKLPSSINTAASNTSLVRFNSLPLSHALATAAICVYR